MATLIREDRSQANHSPRYMLAAHPLVFLYHYSTIRVLVSGWTQAGLWSGSLVLQDLQVRTDVSCKLRLPVVLKQGSVELVRLKVSLRLYILMYVFLAVLAPS